MWVLKKTKQVSRKHAIAADSFTKLAPAATRVNEVIFDALNDRFIVRTFEREVDK